MVTPEYARAYLDEIQRLALPRHPSVRRIPNRSRLVRLLHRISR